MSYQAEQGRQITGSDEGNPAAKKEVTGQDCAIARPAIVEVVGLECLRLPRSC